MGSTHSKDEDCSPDLLQRVLTSAPVGLFAVDRAGAVVLAEGPAGALIGWSPREVRGRSAYELFSEVPPLREAVRRALSGEASLVLVERRGAWWEIRLGPDRDDHGDVVRAVGVVTDQTERKRAEQDARRELWFLDALVENIPDMIFVKDANDLRFVRLNRAGEDLLGHSRGDLIGKSDYDFFPTAEADFFTGKDRAVLRDGKLLEIPEESIHTGHKGVRTLHTKKIPIYDPAGNPLYLLGISADITERKQIEAERQRLVERLSELDQLRAQLVASVSHEFRTPLALIRAWSERLLRQKGPDDPDRSDLEGIERSAHHLLGLVGDLLDVARLDAGRLVADYREVDLARLVRVTAASFEVTATERGIALVVEAPAALQAQVDPRQVQRMLENLLANALRHTPVGGRVRCALERLDHRARIVVADSGPGVPPELREKVFERFYQVKTEHAPEGGTGLGLFVVKALVELHEGSVSVTEAPEGGALFSVDLPLQAPKGTAVRAAVVEAGLIQPPPPEIARPAAPSAPAGAALVLIVEDNPDLNRLLAETLGLHHRVVTAFDGEEGLRRALEVRPDLILTDLMMPRMGGAELVAAVRQRRELDLVPIVILTAKADDELRLRLLREGAGDYVMKPFSTEELVARVGNLVALKRVRDVLRAELASAREDVEELARDLARRNRELQEAVRARDDFLSVASHELNTPLTSLVLSVDKLARAGTTLGPEALARLTDVAARQAARLTRLVRELFDVTRMGREAMSLAVEDVELGALVQDVLAYHELELARAGSPASLQVSGPVVGRWDRSRIEQVVTNLLSNAVKFGAGKPIEIVVAEEAGTARLSVTDHGIGIEPRGQERIFDRYERAVSSRHYGGLGLGLYICKCIVEAHGGSIRVSSSPGEGATFTVELPLAGPQRHLDDDVTPAPAAASSASGSRSRHPS